jgi:hypothetical protein
MRAVRTVRAMRACDAMRGAMRNDARTCDAVRAMPIRACDAMPMRACDACVRAMRAYVRAPCDACGARYAC